MSRPIRVSGLALLAVLAVLALIALISGRPAPDERATGISARQPEVAYLYPATGSPQNIWIARPGDPTSARQITFDPSGVFDFSVSPDGAQIAFSAPNGATGFTDLYQLDLATGGLTQLTNCLNAACTGPVWRPGGQAIAYEREELDAAAPNANASSTRIWLLDPIAVPATTQPLLSDHLQILGHSPRWSADGQTIAFYSPNLGAVIVYQPETGQITSVPSGASTSGDLSPDGTKLAYSEIVINEETGANSVLRLADLENHTDIQLTEADVQADDGRALWRPDGQTLAVARRDERVQRGYQVVEMDPATGEVQPLTTDPRYSNRYFWWNPAGTQLVLQRFAELDENLQPKLDGYPEVWTLDVESGAMTLVAEDGMLPQWVP